MPIYEYECRKCNERFEVLQKASDDGSDLHCPKCQADKPERVLSTFCSGGPKGAGSGASSSAHSAPGHS
jgi:putative FmdB family regulatory protein